MSGSGSDSDDTISCPFSDCEDAHALFESLLAESHWPDTQPDSSETQEGITGAASTSQDQSPVERPLNRQRARSPSLSPVFSKKVVPQPQSSSLDSMQTQPWLAGAKSQDESPKPLNRKRARSPVSPHFSKKVVPQPQSSSLDSMQTQPWLAGAKSQDQSPVPSSESSESWSWEENTLASPRQLKINCEKARRLEEERRASRVRPDPPRQASGAPPRTDADHLHLPWQVASSPSSQEHVKPSRCPNFQRRLCQGLMSTNLAKCGSTC